MAETTLNTQFVETDMEALTKQDSDTTVTNLQSSGDELKSNNGKQPKGIPQEAQLNRSVEANAKGL